MEFEILSGPQHRSSAFEQLEQFLTNRRQQLEQLSLNPPHSLGICIFLTVVLEIVLARRLTLHLGPGPSTLTQFATTAAVLLLIETVILRASNFVGSFFDKKGNPWATVTLFHMSLLPLLLLLPITLLTSLTGRVESLRQFLLILLIFQVAKNWKDVLEIGFKFTRRQSALVMSLIGSAVIFLLMIGVYYSLLQNLVEMLKTLD